MSLNETECPCMTCELPMEDYCTLELEIGTIDGFTKKEIKSTCLHPNEYIAFIDYITHEIMGEAIP